MARPSRPPPPASRSMRASPERIAPICPHFGICGGCALQHLATRALSRLEARARHRGAARKRASTAPVDDLVDAHGEGRRRAVLHARRGTRDVLEVGFAALRAHHVVAIDRCPILAPASTARSRPPGRSPRRSAGARKPLDIQVTRDRCRPRRRRARLGTADGGARGRARAGRRAPPAGAAHPPRRARRAARGADGEHGPRPGRAAAGRFPAGDRRGRSGAGAAGRRALRWSEERSPTCSAASGRSRCGSPSARASPRPTSDADAIAALQRAAAGDTGAQAGRGRSSAICSAARCAGRAQALRRRGVRSAAPGRRGAGARTRGFGAAPTWSRSRAIPRPSRATPASWSTAATGCARHAGRPVPLFGACRAGRALQRVEAVRLRETLRREPSVRLDRYIALSCPSVPATSARRWCRTRAARAPAPAPRGRRACGRRSPAPAWCGSPP